MPGDLTDALEPKTCKVCGSDAPLEGVVDFHKSCEVNRGIHFPLAGVPVYYARCSVCGFLFTDFFDGWSPEDFLRRIYNADYVKVDPEYVEVRPRASAEFVCNLFSDAITGLRVLDYGGGQGTLARVLRERGVAADSYDPFDGDGEEKPGPYDLITCFEVIEHVTDPQALVRAIGSRLAPEGAVLFSTLLAPPDRQAGAMDWWYIAPRNGHASIHTAESLAHLWQSAGFLLGSFDTNMHVAVRGRPGFVRHLIGDSPAP
jgi:2-polyprenyl-6-hydroxyphenyl methylase/3-demethylubiquinone-9 3-methyltransferase